MIGVLEMVLVLPRFSPLPSIKSVRKDDMIIHMLLEVHIIVSISPSP